MNKKNTILNGSTVFFGGICALLCFLSFSLFGNPFESIHLLDGMKILPPIWLFNLISLALFFFAGASAGAVARCTQSRMNTADIEISAYKGALFFLNSFWISLVRNCLFFFTGRLFISLVLSLTCLLTSIACAYTWGKVRPRAASVIMIAFSVWQFYLFFVNFSVFMQN